MRRPERYLRAAIALLNLLSRRYSLPLIAFIAHVRNAYQLPGSVAIKMKARQDHKKVSQPFDQKKVSASIHLC